MKRLLTAVLLVAAPLAVPAHAASCGPLLVDAAGDAGAPMTGGALPPGEDGSGDLTRVDLRAGAREVVATVHLAHMGSTAYRHRWTVAFTSAETTWAMSLNEEDTVEPTYAYLSRADGGQVFRDAGSGTPEIDVDHGVVRMRFPARLWGRYGLSGAVRDAGAVTYLGVPTSGVFNSPWVELDEAGSGQTYRLGCS
jgi:hypothetical protein